MAYIIETFDKPDQMALRVRVRPQHMAYLEANKEKLLACGAKLDDSGEQPNGGLYLVKVETRSEAEKFIADDPFSKAELFERVEITRWRAAFFNGRNMLRPGPGQQAGRGQGGPGRGGPANNAGRGRPGQL